MTDSRTWATCCHLLGLLGYVTGGIGSIVGPLILWLAKKDAVPEVAQHGKEAINFNITIALIEIAIFSAATIALGFRELQLAILSLIGIAVWHVAFTIRAALRAHRGQAYRYPLTFRFVR